MSAGGDPWAGILSGPVDGPARVRAAYPEVPAVSGLRVTHRASRFAGVLVRPRPASRAATRAHLTASGSIAVPRLGARSARAGRILAGVRSYADLQPPLVGAVERLIDFVTEPEDDRP